MPPIPPIIRNNIMLISISKRLPSQQRRPLVPPPVNPQPVKKSVPHRVRIFPWIMDRDVMAPRDHTPFIAVFVGVAFVGSRPTGFVGTVFGVLLPVPVSGIVGADIWGWGGEPVKVLLAEGGSGGEGKG